MNIRIVGYHIQLLKNKGSKERGENKLKYITLFITLLMISMSSMATNKIYVTQAGASLVFDVLQDGDGNMIGNSTTASTSSGSATNFNIDQVGASNILTFDIDGDSFTGTFSTTGNSNNIDFNCDSGSSTSGCDSITASITFTGNSQDIDIDLANTSSKSADGSAVTITGASGTDSTVVSAAIDGTSAILTLTINGDSNNYLINIDDNGDVNGHTLIMTQTGITADVDVVQSGAYDNIATVTSTGDSQNIDINQTAGGTITLVTTGSTSSAVKTVNINQTAHATFTASAGLDGAGGTYDIDQTAASAAMTFDVSGASAAVTANQTAAATLTLTQPGASANINVLQTAAATATLDLDGASGVYDIDQTNASTITLDQTGDNANFVISQAGGSGDIVTMTTNGASANVDIIQRD